MSQPYEDPYPNELTDPADVKRALADIDDTIRDLEDAGCDLYCAIDTARRRLARAQSVILDLLCDHRTFLRD